MLGSFISLWFLFFIFCFVVKRNDKMWPERCTLLLVETIVRQFYVIFFLDFNDMFSVCCYKVFININDFFYIWEEIYESAFLWKCKLVLFGNLDRLFAALIRSDTSVYLFLILLSSHKVLYLLFSCCLFHWSCNISVDAAILMLQKRMLEDMKDLSRNFHLDIRYLLLKSSKNMKN